MRAISLWVLVDESQPNFDHYLVDGRYSVSAALRPDLGNQGAYFGNSAVGSLWSGLYVNGYNKSMAWQGNIPYNEWFHFHLNAAEPFADDLNIMSKTNTGDETYFSGNLKGRLASLMLWGREVPQAELELIGHGGYRQYHFNPYTAELIGYWNIEEERGQYLLDTLDIDNFDRRGRLFPSFDPPVWVRDNPITPGWHPLYIPIAPPQPPVQPPFPPIPPVPPFPPSPPPDLPAAPLLPPSPPLASCAAFSAQPIAASQPTTEPFKPTTPAVEAPAFPF